MCSRAMLCRRLLSTCPYRRATLHAGCVPSPAAYSPRGHAPLTRPASRRLPPACSPPSISSSSTRGSAHRRTRRCSGASATVRARPGGRPAIGREATPAHPCPHAPLLCASPRPTWTAPAYGRRRHHRLRLTRLLVQQGERRQRSRAGSGASRREPRRPPASVGPRARRGCHPRRLERGAYQRKPSGTAAAL